MILNFIFVLKMVGIVVIDSDDYLLKEIVYVCLICFELYKILWFLLCLYIFCYVCLLLYIMFLC